MYLLAGEDTSDDALGPHDRHAILNAIHSVGDAREIVLAQRLLVAVKGTIVRANSLEIT